MALVMVALAIPIFVVLALWFTAWAEARMLTDRPSDPPTTPFAVQPAPPT